MCASRPSVGEVADLTEMDKVCMSEMIRYKEDFRKHIYISSRQVRMGK